LDGTIDLEEVDPRAHELMWAIGEGVARERLFQLGHHADLTRAERLDALLALAPHPRDVAHALPQSAGRVEERRVRADRAGVDAKERELADVGIRQRLEDEGGGGSLGVGRAAGALPRLLIGPV